MTVRIKDILECLNLEAPFSLAESWDNVGLLVGNPEQEVTTIIAGLDPTNSLVDEAITKGANTIITHHPVIFKPLPSINTGDPSGKLLEKLLSNQISIIGCHTNFDSAIEGVSDVLAHGLGLQNLTPLVPTSGEPNDHTGLGRIGSYPSPLNPADFISRLLETLNLPSVQMAGRLPEKISRVAVCGGSGSDLAPTALAQNADVYLSAEIKHSTAIWAVENNFCIVDGTHYATEKPAVALLVRKLQAASRDMNWKIEILQTETERHPFVLTDKSYHL
ncbi:MAG: Nif3-like dinuclear metal center hexameric protein [Desulforhopalus sp.]